MTAPALTATRENIIQAYNLLVGGIEEEAINEEDRAYGGVIRAAKGKLVESIAPHVVRLAWQECAGNQERISFGDSKGYEVPIQESYLNRLPKETRQYISTRLKDYFYRAHVDCHVFVDGD